MAALRSAAAQLVGAVLVDGTAALSGEVEGMRRVLGRAHHFAKVGRLD
jgi:hypothetical protein